MSAAGRRSLRRAPGRGRTVWRTTSMCRCPGSTASSSAQPRQLLRAVDDVQLRDPARAPRWRWSANRAAASPPSRACSSACTAPTPGPIVFDGSRCRPQSTRGRAVMRRRMQMIFQDPYASLNPRWRVQRHRRRAARASTGIAAPATRPTLTRARRAGSAIARLGRAGRRRRRRSFRTSSPAGSASASRSPARWRPRPGVPGLRRAHLARSTFRCRRRCSTS